MTTPCPDGYHGLRRCGHGGVGRIRLVTIILSLEVVSENQLFDKRSYLFLCRGCVECSSPRFRVSVQAEQFGYSNRVAYVLKGTVRRPE